MDHVANKNVFTDFNFNFFRKKYNEVYDFKKQNILSEKAEEPKPANDVHLNDELRAILKVLSLFKNPRALFKQEELHKIYYKYLSSKQSDIQVHTLLS